jgi:LacI family transcriptional regulator
VIDRTTHIQDLLGTRKHRAVVGLSMPPGDPTVPQLLERFRERRWQVIALNAFSWQLPSQVTFDGVLLKNLPTDDIAQRVLAQGTPCVRLGRFPHPDDHLMPVVLPDHAAAGRLAADHFADRDFRHLAFVAYDQWYDNRPLYDAFRQRGAERGCQCHLLTLNEQQLNKQVTEDRSYLDVQRQHVQDWWRSLPRPVGLLVGNDGWANRFCHWAIHAELTVPEEIAILSAGNFPLNCEGALVPLSSIDFDEPAMLDAAIDTLDQLMAGQTPDPPTVIVPPRGVVTRRSTDVLAVSDPFVAAAMRYMADHVNEDLSVDQIAEHVGGGRRSLERAFQRELRRGINAEFQRRRLDKARQLLLQSDLRVVDIAQTLSYSSSRQFCAVFSKAYNQSPARYRKLHRQPD